MTLSRSFLNGALAISAITAAFGFATEAQAFTVGELIDAGSTGVTVSDKRFYDFVIPNSTTGLFDLDDTVNIDDNGGSFDIDFRASGGTLGGSITAAGTILYKVEIISPFINEFKEVMIQNNVTGGSLPGKTATRTYTATGLPSTLTATNNGSDSGMFQNGPKLISVVDSWSFTGTGSRNSLTSIAANYIQNPERPTTPEPSAVLGVLALGLCGTLAARKKG